MTWQTINPASGAVIANYEETSPEAVQATIASAHQAFIEWRSTSFRERAALMRRAADVLRGNAREYARLMAEEMGKPVRDGVAEIQKCAGGCDYYAENAERFLAPEPVAMKLARVTSRSIRSASCSPSCRGISRSGRCSASPRQGSWLATPLC